MKNILKYKKLFAIIIIIISFVALNTVRSSAYNKNKLLAGFYKVGEYDIEDTDCFNTRIVKYVDPKEDTIMYIVIDYKDVKAIDVIKSKYDWKEKD